MDEGERDLDAVGDSCVYVIGRDWSLWQLLRFLDTYILDQGHMNGDRDRVYLGREKNS